MTGQELLETYPKAAGVVKKFYLNQLMDSLQDDSISPEYRDSIKAQESYFGNDIIANFIDVSPRGLFDVFDDNKVYIEILVDYKDGVIFTYIVRDLGEMYTEPIKYNVRKEAEAVAVEQAFKLLNDKL